MASYFGNLMNRFARNFGQKARVFTNLFNIGGQATTSPDINQDRAITDGYNGNGTVFSVINKDLKKFGSIPRYVYKKNSTGDAEVIENDLSKLLDRPNEYQGYSSFMKSVRGFYKVCGESFIWLNRGDTDKLVNGELVPRLDKEIDAMPVLEMYVIPANRMYIVPDPFNVFGIAAYEFDSGGRRLRIRKNDIIHWRDTTLDFDAWDRKHLRGMPALKPGRQFLQQNNDANEGATRMFQNDGARGIAFNESYNDLDPKQMSDMRDVVDKRVNNNSIKGAVAALQGKWGYVNFGGTAVDMELINALKMSKQDLCMLFDVPFEFFIDTTYENKDKAMRGWVLHSIIPDEKDLDCELNRQLLRAFGLEKTAYIGCDYTELPELQEDMQKLVTQLAAAWWISPNEKRKVMGYEPNPDKVYDEYWVPMGIQPYSMMNADDGFDDLVDETENE